MRWGVHQQPEGRANVALPQSDVETQDGHEQDHQPHHIQSLAPDLHLCARRTADLSLRQVINQAQPPASFQMVSFFDRCNYSAQRD